MTYKSLHFSNSDGGYDACIVDNQEENLKSWLMRRGLYSSELLTRIQMTYPLILILKELRIVEYKRNKGLGTYFLKEIISIASQENVDAIILECDLYEFNQFNLQNWYESFGFMIITRGTNPLMLLEI